MLKIIRLCFFVDVVYMAAVGHERQKFRSPGSRSRATVGVRTLCLRSSDHRGPGAEPW